MEALILTGATTLGSYMVRPMKLVRGWFGKVGDGWILDCPCKITEKKLGKTLTRFGYLRQRSLNQSHNSPLTWFRKVSRVVTGIG